jgi:hypothetical protein
MRGSGCPSQPRSTRNSASRGGHAAGLNALANPPLRKVVAQITDDLGSSFFKPLKKPNGVSSSARDFGVIAKSCGGSCCEAVVGPVVTVSHAGLLRTPGGGRVLDRCAADAGDTTTIKARSRK